MKASINLIFLAVLLSECLISSNSVRFYSITPSIQSCHRSKLHEDTRLPLSRYAAVMPGDPVVTGVFFQGISNAISLFSNIILLRIALSWFPQLPRTFPILNPVFTVTEPYLKFFRRQIPAIGGFDISAIPAIFLLDIFSQASVALGAENPLL